MSISIDTNGRVVTGRTNVIIPPENAGVGDIILKNSNGDVKIVGWGTYSSTGLPSGFKAYGVIYGFVNGMARVVALEEEARRWTMAASDTGSPSSSGSDNVNGGYDVQPSTVVWRRVQKGLSSTGEPSAFHATSPFGTTV